MTKKPVRSAVKVNTYEVFRRALEEGVEAGWQRAHKHTDTPSDEAIMEEITTAVLCSVTEYFDFGP